MIANRLLFASLLLGLASTLAIAADDLALEKIRHAYAMLDAPASENPASPDNAFTKTVFAPGFLALWKENEKCWNENSEGVQVWVWGQDVQLSDLVIAMAKQTSDEQIVKATFKNFGKAQDWDYVFHRHGDSWLADDVLQAGESLSQTMAKGCGG